MNTVKIPDRPNASNAARSAAENAVRSRGTNAGRVENAPRATDVPPRCIAEENLKDTGFAYTLSLISGKYKMTVLYTLSEFGVVRFNELKRYISSVTYKTLSLTLKELERDGLVHREEYPQIPPKVEYSLTDRGKSLMPILDALCEWGGKNRL